MNDTGGPPGPGLTKRVLGFAGLPFLSLLTPFLFLPLLSRLGGSDAWLAIAVGQSVGAFFALFIALGYNTVGPTIVAAADPVDRPQILRQSVLARLIIFLPAVVIATVIASAVGPAGHRVESALMSVAMALTGLSSSWYMVGLGRAGLIVVYEMLPRMVATLSAAVLLIFFGIVVCYPILLIVGGTFSVVVFLGKTVGLKELRTPRQGEIRQVMRINRTAMMTEVVAGAYNTLGVTLVSLAATTAQAASYVSGDKVYRIGQYSVSALGNALQGWVVEENRSRFVYRARRALFLHAALGVFGLSVFATLGPWVSGLLFGENIVIDRSTAVGFGVATLGIAMGTAIGRVILIGLNARSEFLLSVVIGASVGVTAILILASIYGAAGGAWGLAIGEVASVTTQSIFARRVWRLSGLTRFRSEPS